LQQKKKSRTIDEYSHVVHSFFSWLQEEYENLLSPNQITMLHVSEWIGYLNRFNLAPTTIHKKLAALKTYWNFIELQGYSQSNPMKAFGLPRPLSVSKSFLSLTKEEEETFMNEVKKEKNEWKRWRNLNMLYLMLYLGLRVSEVIQLKRKDILWERQLLQVQDEHGDVRLLPISTHLIHSLAIWVRKANPPFYLFPSSLEGGPLTRQSLHYIVKKYFKVSGIPHHSAQSLRNTFIKQSLKNGLNLTNIAGLLGLKTTESLQKYL
jgi:site-specific recombinase XerD